MFPAFPTGSASTSGASPRSATISCAAVACPAMRCGLMEFTISTPPPPAPSSRTISSASSKLPRIEITFAPAAKACSSFPAAIFPAGSKTTASIPAAAAYAAADAEVLPVLAQTTARAPDSSAFATATTMPRSLNEPVGFVPSTFSHRSDAPIDAPRRGARTRGVAPSPNVSIGVAAVTGSTERKRSISTGRADRSALMRHRASSLPPRTMPEPARYPLVGARPTTNLRHLQSQGCR